MDKQMIEKMKNTLDMIPEDMEKDMHGLEGAPFNGKVVAEEFAHLAAAISALSKIMKRIVDECVDREE